MHTRTVLTYLPRLRIIDFFFVKHFRNLREKLRYHYLRQTNAVDTAD